MRSRELHWCSFQLLPLLAFPGPHLRGAAGVLMGVEALMEEKPFMAADIPALKGADILAEAPVAAVDPPLPTWRSAGSLDERTADA